MCYSIVDLYNSVNLPNEADEDLTFPGISQKINETAKKCPQTSWQINKIILNAHSRRLYLQHSTLPPPLSKINLHWDWTCELTISARRLYHCTSYIRTALRYNENLAAKLEFN